MDNQNPRSAFIAIVGRPNVGKSSILNQLIGQKIAIVSQKPQTTRTRIMGVLTQGVYQFVFIDTPGLIKAKNPLGDYMVESVSHSVQNVEMALLVTEAGSQISMADADLIKRFKKLDLPVILAINKIDLIQDKKLIAEQIQTFSKAYPFEAIVPVSAKRGDGMEALLEELKKLSQEGDHHFPEDELTNQPERVIASEMVREKLLRFLDKEVPHGIAAVTETMVERNEMLHIEVNIYCERMSHKGIVIGKQGTMLKKIGTKAREDMERFFDCKVNLQLWVKVKEDWRRRGNLLQEFGFNRKDFKQ